MKLCEMSRKMETEEEKASRGEASTDYSNDGYFSGIAFLCVITD